MFHFLSQKLKISRKMAYLFGRKNDCRRADAFELCAIDVIVQCVGPLKIDYPSIFLSESIIIVDTTLKCVHY